MNISIVYSIVLIYLIGLFTIIVGINYGKRKYATYINPLSFMLIIQFFVFQLISGFFSIFTKNILSLSYSEDTYLYTLSLSVIGALIFLSSYKYISVNIFVNFISKYFYKTDLIVHNQKKLKSLKWSFFIFGMLSFIYLIIFTSGKTLWVLDPRTAYIEHRNGSGQYYAMFIWFINISFIIYLFEIRASENLKYYKLVVNLAIYLLILYFTGSKGAMITPIILAIFFYDLYYKKINFSTFFNLAIIITLLGSILIVNQMSSVAGIFIYLSEYFNMTAEYMHYSNDIGLYYGFSLLSEIYSMIPRSLFGDKPYIYGVLYIHDYITPGQAELGNTFGIMPWARSYLDFGIFGVLLHNIYNAIITKITYEYWRLKPNFYRFIICLSFVLWSPFPFSNPVIIFLLLGFITIISKIRI